MILKIIKSITNKELQVGSLTFVVTLFILFLFKDSYNFIKILPIGINWLAILLIVDWAYRKIHKKSYIPESKRSIKKFIKISIVSILFCLILDGYGVFGSRLWYYPYMPLNLYIYIAPIAYILYTLVLFTLYEIIKKKLDDKVRGGRPTNFKKAIYRIIITLQLPVGIIGLIYSSIYMWTLTQRFTVPIWEGTITSNVEVEWWFIFLVLLSFGFIFEYLNFKRGKETLTRDLINGNFVPLISIFIATTLGLVLIEYINTPLQIWIFDNWMFNDFKIMQIPVIAYFAWPFQFFAFLSMMRFALNESEDIW